MRSLSSTLTASWKAEGPSRVSDSKSSAGGERAGAVPFEALYDEHVGFVWRTLRGMGVPKELVPDAAQDVFVVVHRKLADFDGRFAFKTWLFQIIYRVVCEYRRAARKAATQESLDRVPALSAPGSGDPQMRHEASSLLAELLAGLDEDKRIVLLLAEVEEMTAPEIAAATRTPLNTVYTRLRRARAELSTALEKRRRSAR
jgi:RNA polymerase sigma-70 factor (ECF subfamily)